MATQAKVNKNMLVLLSDILTELQAIRAALEVPANGGDAAPSDDAAEPEVKEAVNAKKNK